MQMTPWEMNRSYLNAESRTKQIKILSELNGISRQEVIHILRQFGNDIKAPKKIKRTIWTAEMVDKLRELYMAGIEYDEIGRELGVSSQAVQTKIVNEGINALRKQRQKGKTPHLRRTDREPDK